jgi:hypothetical protein
MINVDVPMYGSRWLRDEALQVSYLSLLDGWRDASERWVVTWQPARWQGEMLWMSLYFSIGVWVSMALTRLPMAASAGATSAAAAPAAEGHPA